MKKFLLILIALIATVALSAQNLTYFTAVSDTLTDADTLTVTVPNDISKLENYSWGIKLDTITGTSATSYVLYSTYDGTNWFSLVDFTNGHRPLDTIVSGTNYGFKQKLVIISSGTNTQKYTVGNGFSKARQNK